MSLPSFMIPRPGLGPAAALYYLPECVTGNPLTDRLPEGVGGEQAPAWKSSNWMLPLLFGSGCDC